MNNQLSLSIAGLSIAKMKGTPNEARESIVLTERGIEGDRHAAPGARQVSLMDAASARARAQAKGDPYTPGCCKENLAIEGLHADKLEVLDRLEIGDVLLEITEAGHVHDPDTCGSKCGISEHGAFARVLNGGTIRMGDAVEHHRRVLRVHILTLSDRAHAGAYEDSGGPRIQERLRTYSEEHRWPLVTETLLLPDEAEPLRAALSRARAAHVDVVFTTGGTGPGPRDITPDVVTALADKVIPGIMEHIRQKNAERLPTALLSRSVAAVMGSTLVYTLPGAPKAIDEYMDEILKTFKHLIYVVRGIDAH